MKLVLIKRLATVGCLFISFGIHAASYTPTSPDTLIASWPVATSPELQQAQAAKRLRPADPKAVAELANQYLALANKPGQSRLYGLAQSVLKPLVENNTATTPVWLAWAQVLQHQHRFDESLAAIEKVRAQEPKNVNANLLAARIYLIQDKPAQAKQACLKLLGYSDLLTTSACVLEITSHEPGKLGESYQQLKNLVAREGFPKDERGPWFAQLLADMALRSNNPKAAEDYLTPQLSNASVNYLAQWADTQLAQNKPDTLISYLAPIVQTAPEQDDLLLLQLALAEKIQGANTRWQLQLADRIALREQRMDQQHANEVARFYLDINPQPEKAVHWAQIHLQKSHEESDKKLLERAQAAQQPITQQPSKG